MESNSQILQLCRLCLDKDSVNIPIFEEQGDIRQIYLKISSCLPVKVSRDDRLPKKICDGCSHKLDVVYEFHNTTVSAEKQLLEWLEDSNVISETVEKHTETSTQQNRPTETQVKQEEIDPSDIQKEEDEEDDKNYLFEQSFHDSSGTAGPSATTIEEEEEEPPPPKRAKRTAAVKAAIAMDQSDDDDDDDLGEPLTKVEDESEDSEGEDQETPFVDVPSTSADDQPGPSGVGKEGEAPLNTPVNGPMCYICLKPYRSLDELENHQHVLPNLVFCIRCKGYFSITHQCPKSNLHCAFCKEGFHDASINEHKCFYIYTKDDLEKILKYEKNIKSKLVRKRKQLECGFRTKMCKICNMEFTTQRDYDIHYYRLHKTRTCQICSIEFEKPTQYRWHYLDKHKQEKYQICPYCGKSLLHLSQHLKAVHGNKDEVRCSICEKTFTCKKRLIRHNLVHSNEFKHKCTICNKGFKTPFSLKVHRRSHDEVKPFECTVCKKTFTTKQWRDNHQKTH